MDKLEELAKQYGVELAAVKAVIEVESNGKQGAYLFEPHLFHRVSKGIYSKEHPDISHPKWDKASYKTNEANFKKAFALNKDWAIHSTSMGIFQICGMNKDYCGIKDYDTFLLVMTGPLDGQYEAFFKFISNRGMLKHLISKDWVKFAEAYNGPAYSSNSYDKKLAKAYIKHGGK